MEMTFMKATHLQSRVVPFWNFVLFYIFSTILENIHMCPFDVFIKLFFGGEETDTYLGFGKLCRIVSWHQDNGCLPQFIQIDLKLEMKIVFLILRYCRLSYSWDMHNALVFDCRYGVRAYLQKLNGVFMWKFLYWIN